MLQTLLFKFTLEFSIVRASFLRCIELKNRILIEYLRYEMNWLVKNIID